MFSSQQKREISMRVQAILQETTHDELPDSEINFILHVDGAESWPGLIFETTQHAKYPPLMSW